LTRLRLIDQCLGTPEVQQRADQRAAQLPRGCRILEQVTPGRTSQAQQPLE
jgi:hypothetical protein